jgi:hypothetical protein
MITTFPLFTFRRDRYMTLTTGYKIGLASMLAIAIMLSDSSRAAGGAIIAYDSNISASLRTGGPYVVGTLFTVTSATDQVLTALGVQDTPNGDGFTGTSPVGIWNASGTTLLAKATVSNSTPLSGPDFYRYTTDLRDTNNVPLTSSVVLVSGQQYLLGAVVGGSFEAFFDGNFAEAVGQTPFSGDMGFTINVARYAPGSTLVAPTTFGNNFAGAWAPANALVAPVPEPNSMIIFSIGLIGIWRAYRRRRISA